MIALSAVFALTLLSPFQTAQAKDDAACWTCVSYGNGSSHVDVLIGIGEKIAPGEQHSGAVPFPCDSHTGYNAAT